MNNGYCNISVKEKKYKKSSRGSLNNLGIHLLRTHKQEYALADKDRRNQNEVLIGMSEKTVVQSLNEYFKKYNLKPRNSETVQAYQMVFSIPSEHIGNVKLVEEFKKRTLEMLKTHPVFKDNVLLAVYHGDETQPHIQAICVPRLNGKLNFKELLGGPSGSAKISQLHDDFAAVMKPLGFQRGDGSHTNGLTHKQYMRSVKELNSPLPKPVGLEEVPDTTIFNKNRVIGILEDNNSRLEKENKRLKSSLKKLEFYSSQNVALKKTNSALKKHKAKFEGDKMKTDEEKLEKLRAIECSEVLESLGYQPKSEGNTYRLKTDDLNLVINSENKFTENKSMTSGGGAIDLLCKVFKYSFKEARDYLAVKFGFDRTTAVVLASPERTATTVKAQVKKSALELPVPKPANLPKIYEYLAEKRGISRELIDELVNNGLLYADSKNNCVFTNEQKSFAFIRGTYEGKRFVGVRGEIDFLSYDFGNSGNKNLYVFESAIDALSYKTLNPTHLGQYIVLNGSALINEISTIADNFDTVHCCFDNDEQGKKFCDKIKGATTSKVVIKKPKSKDFNEDLVNGYSTTPSPSVSLGNSKNAIGSAGEAESTNDTPAERDRKTRFKIS